MSGTFSKRMNTLIAVNGLLLAISLMAVLAILLRVTGFRPDFSRVVDSIVALNLALLNALDSERKQDASRMAVLPHVARN